MKNSLYLPSIDDVHHHLTAARDTGALPEGSLHILVGDFHSYAKYGVFVDEVPDDPPLAERVHVLQNSLTAIAEVVHLHSVLLAIRRCGDHEMTQGDVDWRDAFTAATAAADTLCLGVYIVTEEHVGRLGGPTSLAA